jgi:transcriptional regulator with XRE-family HTH domain
MDLSGFPNLLDQAFLEYRIRQTRQRLSVSLNSFANFLEFSPTIVNMWLNGKKVPSKGNLERIIPYLVELLGPEVYDTLDLPKPDLDLQRLTQIWENIPPTNRRILADLAEKFATEGESASNASDLPDLDRRESKPL